MHITAIIISEHFHCYDYKLLDSKLQLTVIIEQLL